MNASLWRKLGSAALSAVVVTACADAPTPVAPEAGLFFGSAVDGAPVVQRSSSSNGAAATGWIGPDGGTLSAGEFTLTVPAGALSEAVHITMVVPRGKDVQVKFAPHGLTFSKPATLSVDLAGLSGFTALSGAYFTGNIVEGVVNPLEVFPVTLSGNVASFEITHFSGYCVIGSSCDCPEDW